VLWQNYSNSAIGEHNAVGHKFTFNTEIELLNRGRPDALIFDVGSRIGGRLELSFRPCLVASPQAPPSGVTR
jgi:hypothetical protein